jgi:YhcG PDDEXK nuclease domain
MPGWLRLRSRIELKNWGIPAQAHWKMQFYIAVLDDTARLEGENPAIGILICQSKDKTIVENALKESSVAPKKPSTGDSGR